MLLPQRKTGSGRPAIWPVEIYISNNKKSKDHPSLFFSLGVSLSLSSSSCSRKEMLPGLPNGDFPLPLPLSLPSGAAPYPAAITAFIVLSCEALPSTVIEFVSRDTEHAVTPATAITAFSILAEQAAQLMPVMEYLCIYKLYEINLN